MTYPKPFQVELASQVQLGRWQELLPEPTTAVEASLMDRIKARFGGWTADVRHRMHWSTLEKEARQPC